MSNTPFRQVQFIGQPLVSDNFEANIMGWLNWNLLGVCAFVNVNIPTSGSYGGNYHQLQYRTNPQYTNGQVWEGFRKQWIWQSGVDCQTQPIQISGVFVNNVFCPTSGVGPNSFKIDYPNGRIVFNNPISTSATVTCAYSFNYYQIYNTDSPWWKEVQRNSYRIDDSAFNTTASGVWAKPPEQRVQLPCIIVEAVPSFQKEGYELGGRSHNHKQKLRLYVIAETARDRKFIIDTLSHQYQADLQSFDLATMYAQGKSPLDLNGSLKNVPGNYPDWLNSYNWNRFISIRGVQGSSPVHGEDINYPLFTGTIELNLETYLS